MAISNTWIANGTQDTFNYTFAIPGSFSAVVVKTKPPGSPGFLLWLKGTHYTEDTSLKTITFLSGFVPIDQTIVLLERFTTRTRQIDYVSGSTLSERNLDNDANRLAAVDEEIEGGVGNALKRTDDNTQWNAEGLPSVGGQPATDPTGWVTLAQMEAAVVGGGVGEISGAKVFHFTGDGNTFLFPLADVSNISTEIVDVYVEGVYQSSLGTVYEVIHDDDTRHPGGTTDDYLWFVNPPTDLAEIEIKVFTATLITSAGPSSVDTDSLADGAVTPPKMSALPGVTHRFLVADAVGVYTARRIGIEDLLGTLSFTGPALTALLAGVRANQLLQPMNGPLNCGGNKLTNMADPQSVLDAANKNYVDNQIATVQPPNIQMQWSHFAAQDLSNNPTGLPLIITTSFYPKVLIFHNGNGTHTAGVNVRISPLTVALSLQLGDESFPDPPVGVQSRNALFGPPSLINISSPDDGVYGPCGFRVETNPGNNWFKLLPTHTMIWGIGEITWLAIGF